MEEFRNEEIEKIRQEYREELKYSRYHLDDACDDQVDFFDRWHQRYVDAMAQREHLQDELKKKQEKLKAKYNELSAKLRNAIAGGVQEVVVGEFGLLVAKPTEGAVDSAINGQDIYISLGVEVSEANTKIVEAKYFESMLSGASDAFKQRKEMLRELNGLFITGYFGDVDSVSKREIDEKLAKVTKVPKQVDGSDLKKVDQTNTPAVRRRVKK